MNTLGFCCIEAMYPFLPDTPRSPSQSAKKKILQSIRKRKISGLTHFTRIDNLRSILSTGILPRTIIQKNRAFEKAVLSPTPMPEQWQSMVPLNVSFPDHRLFSQMRVHDPSDWVVLVIDPKIIADIPAYFFPARAVDFINYAKSEDEVLTDFESASAWDYLFTDQVGAKRADLMIPDGYPTNPYTEVLTFFPIAPSSIIEIHFCNDYKFNQWILSNTEFALTQDRNRWACSLQYFSPRSDASYWKTQRNLS